MRRHCPPANRHAPLRFRFAVASSSAKCARYCRESPPSNSTVRMPNRDYLAEPFEQFKRAA